jgi:hypothetical protein
VGEDRGGASERRAGHDDTRSAVEDPRRDGERYEVRHEDGDVRGKRALQMAAGDATLVGIAEVVAQKITRRRAGDDFVDHDERLEHDRERDEREGENAQARVAGDDRTEEQRDAPEVAAVRTATRHANHAREQRVIVVTERVPELVGRRRVRARRVLTIHVLVEHDGLRRRMVEVAVPALRVLDGCHGDAEDVQALERLA